MKNKAPLALMEQVIMLLVFALAAGLCLQVFVLSDHMSRQFEARDHAVLAVQNAAEVLKEAGGNPEACAQLYGGAVHDETWEICYDSGWNPVPAREAKYCVTAVIEQRQTFLGTARISAVNLDGETLFEVMVSWQEDAHE